MEVAHSKLCPKLHGKILRWVDDEQFIILCQGREIIGHKQYWRVMNEADCF